MVTKTLTYLSILYIIYYILWSKPDQAVQPPPASEMRTRIKKTLQTSFWDYHKHGWGSDVYHPISKTGENMGPRPLGWMVVDCLDTLMLMGLSKEEKVARKWVAEELDYDFDYAVNTFETTIRMLGGLLSAHYLSGDQLYLDKAQDLGDRIIKAFDLPTGIPYASINLRTGQGLRSHADGGASLTAEVATLQLELKYLSHLTGDPKYWRKAEKAMEVLYNGNKPEDGLVPIFIHPDNGKFRGKYIRLGSRGDSYYEYLLKQYLQTGERVYWNMYRESVDGVKKHMLGKLYPSGLTFIGELENGIGNGLLSKMDHLVCFYGGSLALGATEGLTETDYRKDRLWTSLRSLDLALGRAVTEACYAMYNQTATGLAPEIVVFNTDKDSKEDFYIKPADRHNLQRPETVESLFILWRITKDPIYRVWGAQIYESFEKHLKTHGAFDSISDVTNPSDVRFRDNMESFWLAETLKYLYLLFEEDDVIPLTDNVFNTEAHPLPRFEPKWPTGWKAYNEKKDPVEQVIKFQKGRGDAL